VEAAARVKELIDTECRELLGMAGTRIFSNLQCLRPDLDLLDVLQRREITPPGTPDHRAIAKATRLDMALQRLQAIYSRLGTSSAARPESSSSEEATSSEESRDEDVAESGDEEAAKSSNKEVASPTSILSLGNV
jgi:hypothetical protein